MRLDAERLAEAIRRSELGIASRESDLPKPLRKSAKLDKLLEIIADVMSAAVSTESSERVETFDGCAVFPCHGGGLAAPEIAALENPATIALLGALPDLMFVDVERISRVDERLKELFAPAELRRVVDALDAAHQTGTLRGFLEIGSWATAAMDRPPQR